MIKKEDLSDAEMEENHKKNRDPEILPANNSRPLLMTTVPGCNNYINAVFVHVSKAFI